MSRRSAVLALGAIVALTAPFAAVPAHAQFALSRDSRAETPVLPSVDEDSPVLLEADSLTYDSRTETVIATGNATVYYGTYTVRADRITYDRNNDTVVAFGNVVISEPGGTTLEAEEIELSDELREGFIYSVNAILSNNAHIAAESGQRRGGNVTEFTNAVYTACERCEEDPNKPLTWELKAVKVRHDQLEQTVEYEDVTLEIFGHPVAYFPYFYHPDPSVKRKSGFLTPSFNSSNFYGIGVRVPYFFNLAPNYDLTFAPLITTKQGPVFDFKWRHRPNNNGSYTIRPTFIWQADPPNTAPGNETFRGSVQTDGEFAINEWWSWGWDVTATTDDTYLRRYDINSGSDIVSQLHLTGISDRNYFSARGYKFDGLLASDNDSTLPLIHPVVDHNYIFGRQVFGGELGIDTTFISATRDTGADSTRLSTDLHWERTFIGAGGSLAKPFISLRGDVYGVDNLPDSSVPGGVRDDESFARFLPTAGLEYSMPLARSDQLGTHIFEPIAQVIVRPDETNVNDISNEDAVSVNFETSNLFDRDKFSGVDRFEGGTRANLGFRYSVSDYYGGTTDVTFGQSYHLGGDNPFDVESGLSSDSSDYVGSAYYRPSENFQVGWRARMDETDFNLESHEASVALTHNDFRASVAYAELDSRANQLANVRREEVRGYASYRLHEHWEVFGGATYDIEEGQMLRNQVGLGYDDECFVFRLSFEETFFNDRDINADQRVMVSFGLKTIGGTSFNQSVGSQ